MSGKPRMSGRAAALEYFDVPDAERADARLRRPQADDGRSSSSRPASSRPTPTRCGSSSPSRTAGSGSRRPRRRRTPGCSCARSGSTRSPRSRASAYDFVAPGLTLLDFFDADISGRDFAQGKPHPEIFLTAAGELGVAAGALLRGRGRRLGHPGRQGRRHGRARASRAPTTRSALAERGRRPRRRRRSTTSTSSGSEGAAGHDGRLTAARAQPESGAVTRIGPSGAVRLVRGWAVTASASAPAESVRHAHGLRRAGRLEEAGRLGHAVAQHPELVGVARVEGRQPVQAHDGGVLAGHVDDPAGDARARPRVAGDRERGDVLAAAARRSSAGRCSTPAGARRSRRDGHDAGHGRGSSRRRRAGGRRGAPAPRAGGPPSAPRPPRARPPRRARCAMIDVAQRRRRIAWRDGEGQDARRRRAGPRAPRGRPRTRPRGPRPARPRAGSAAPRATGASRSRRASCSRVMPSPPRPRRGRGAAARARAASGSSPSRAAARASRRSPGG